MIIDAKGKLFISIRKSLLRAWYKKRKAEDDKKCKQDKKH